MAWAGGPASNLPVSGKSGPFEHASRAPPRTPCTPTMASGAEIKVHGWLLKKKKGRSDKFEKRFFELYGSMTSLKLAWFKNEGSSKPSSRRWSSSRSTCAVRRPPAASRPASRSVDLGYRTRSTPTAIITDPASLELLGAHADPALPG